MAQTQNRTYQACNYTAATQVGKTVVIAAVPGYSPTSYTADSGTLDLDTMVWTIPSLEPDECVEIHVVYTQDACGTECDDPCSGDCANPQAGPVSIAHPEVVKLYGSIPSTALCSCGNSILEVLSEVNATVVLNSDGTYEVTITDPSLDWEFTYQITCVANNTEYGPFGPGTVTGTAIGVINTVSNCEDVIDCVNTDFSDIDFTNIDATQAGDISSALISGDAGNDLTTGGVDGKLFVQYPKFETGGDAYDTDVTGSVTIAHTLGVVPGHVSVVAHSYGDAVIPEITAMAVGSFTVKLYDADSSAIVLDTVSLTWAVFE